MTSTDDAALAFVASALVLGAFVLVAGVIDRRQNAARTATLDLRAREGLALLRELAELIRKGVEAPEAEPIYIAITFATQGEGRSSELVLACNWSGEARLEMQYPVRIMRVRVVSPAHVTIQHLSIGGRIFGNFPGLRELRASREMHLGQHLIVKAAPPVAPQERRLA